MQKLLLFLLFSTTVALAQQPSSLQLNEIMKGERYVGYLPEDIQWSKDGKYVYFSWNPKMETIRSLYKVEIASGEISEVTFDEQRNIIPDGLYNHSGNLMAYDKQGDLYLWDIKDKKARLVTNTIEKESVISFDKNDQTLVYQRSNNLFSWNLKNGETVQLTNFINHEKLKTAIKGNEDKWLENQQMGLFGVLNERKQRSEAYEVLRDSLKQKRPKEIYLGDREISNIAISPDLNYVTYRLKHNVHTPSTNVTDFVTESGYTSQRHSRPKVSSPQDTYEMAIYDIKNDTVFTVDTKQIEGIYDKPEYIKEYNSADSSYYKTPRNVVIHGPVYSPDGRALVDIRALDNKDRWLMLLSLNTGKLELIDRQHDDAWIGGPGISSWNFHPGNYGWLNKETIWFQSEATGYSHIYTYSINNHEKKPLTEGQFEIRSAQLSKDKKWFYIQSNAKSPHENHFYKLSVGGGKMIQITTKKGGNRAYTSPDEKSLAVLHSYSNRPWELFIMKNQPGATMTQITNSVTDDFKAYNWKAPDVIRFKASDSADVSARLYKPNKSNGAAVIFVHGAGYLQNVHYWWSLYYREYMFHNLLSDQGYTVLDIDYRGSDGYGRDWRTGIYRHMGGKDLSDQIDGAQYLVENLGIDKNRIGIYGGSYGGFITLMAMFTAPETFQSGAALRSVTDWAHYNYDYTANILNTPTADSIAYARSSPINYAEGLQGRLLMLHGMIDQNVQFQDVVRLSQRLIELRKKNWDLAVFPLERHGFIEATSWADEYRRIYEMFEDTIGKE